MIERWKTWLMQQKRVTIRLEALEKFAQTSRENYDTFVEEILQLEKDGVLEMVKSKGRTSRTPSLAYQYRIQKYALTKEYHQELQRYRHTLHPLIHLDAYYSLAPAIFDKDVPFLQKINEYLHTFGLPTDEVPGPERSFELVGNEKWIEEGGGKALLERVQLWEALRIFPVSDPLMFAVHPEKGKDAVQLHLIVENKTTYQALAMVLSQMEFATLIYGAGNKIVKSLEQFPIQYPVQTTHHFLYFGDLDWSGISIWHAVTKRFAVGLALPFYRACLKKEAVHGKTNQRKDEEAFAHFCTYVTEEEREKVRAILENGKYYPQEVLKTKQLQQIGRETDWKSFVGSML